MVCRLGAAGKRADLSQCCGSNVVAGLLTESPPPTAGLTASGLTASGGQRGAGRPSVECCAGLGDPRTTELNTMQAC
jgi:hypothetical protein